MQAENAVVQDVARDGTADVGLGAGCEGDGVNAFAADDVALDDVAGRAGVADVNAIASVAADDIASLGIGAAHGDVGCAALDAHAHVAVGEQRCADEVAFDHDARGAGDDVNTVDVARNDVAGPSARRGSQPADYVGGIAGEDFDAGKVTHAMRSRGVDANEIAFDQGAAAAE